MNNGYTDAYEKAVKELEKLSFSDKMKVLRTTALYRFHPNFIKYNGYVAKKEHFAVNGGEQDYYVYLWKHIDGDIFYVGSGKGERYCTKNNRNVEFFRHIDKGDAVVYMVLYGVDSKTARFYERYLSLSLGLADYALANQDNNVLRVGEDKSRSWLDDNRSKLDNELTRKIEDVVLNKISLDNNFDASHFTEIQTFRNECGDTYFSRGGFRTYLQTEVG